MIVTYVTSMTTLKTDLSDSIWKKWTAAKSDIGGGDSITSEQAIEKLVDFYNNNKGRRII